MQELIKQYKDKFGVEMPILMGKSGAEYELLEVSLKAGKPLTVEELEARLEDDDENRIY